MKLITYALSGLIVLGIELTMDNFSEKTKGKTVFINFFSPWMGDNVGMQSAWDELMEMYDNRSPTTLIAQVDCHGSGESLCVDLKVDEPIPQLMYGNPENLNPYMGSSDYNALVTFAEKNIGPICGPSNFDLCDEDEKTKIKEIEAVGIEKLKAKIAGIDLIVRSTQSNFQAQIEKIYEEIEEEYNRLMIEKEKSLDEFRVKNDIGLIKIVLEDLIDEIDHIEL